jgi:hypothetical protein
MNSADAFVVKQVVQGVVAGALEPLHEFIRELAGPSASELGEAWRDRVRVWRLGRALRLKQRVEEFIRPLGVERRDVPLKFLIPAVESASLEDDDFLQDHWAALLADAASPRSRNELTASFIELLKQLSARDARFVHAIVTAANDSTGSDLGNFGSLQTLCAKTNQEPGSGGLDYGDSALVIDNAKRLGFLKTRRRSPAPDSMFTAVDPDDNPSETHYFATEIAIEFVRICERRPVRTARDR